MKELYPIGTALVTKELWKADLLYKAFGEVSIESFFDDQPDGSKWRDGFLRNGIPWRITVTDENQELLSPIPLVGDYICMFEDEPENNYYNVGGVVSEKLPLPRTISNPHIYIPHIYIINSYESSIYVNEPQARVLERTYNGLRLPFIGDWLVVVP